jgi:energy-coupling factor transporter transmembrane protein EcfT
LPWLKRHYLFVLAAGVVLLALVLARSRMRKSFPRLKWLFIAVLGIYAWTTPGIYVWPIWFSPTVAGLSSGFEQCVRLLVVVASLQIMLTYLDKNDIVSGLYYIMRPFELFGLSAKRLALRLALTINDAEWLLEQKKSFAELLQGLMQPNLNTDRNEVVSIKVLNRGQTGLLAFQMALIGLTVWIGNYALWN